jgi:L,D-transpeptidase YcbB
MIARLVGADSLGLDPADFDAEALENSLQILSSKRARPTAAERAHFDVALSIGAARMLSALDVGRVAPKVAHENVFLPAPEPTPGATLAALRDEFQQAETLRQVQPQFRQYQLLKNALVRYHKLALDPTLNAGLDLPKDLRPGDPLPNAARLRKLLEATGDLGKHKRPKAKNDTVYSPELVEAVQKFQVRHGQMPDGILFIQTTRELERPFAERARQVELALERWRWLPETFAAPPILVNIPAFRLHAYRTLDPNHEDVLDMDVLVGAAEKSETPVFTAEMKYLVFRPWWDLPASIQTFELGPRAQWDWENMQKLGYVIVGPGGRTTELSAANADRIGKGVDMRQKPGEKNALGLVKFIMPNPHDIYLHDTPAKGLFEFPRRDMSHGCVRVSDPPALAEHVLRGQGEWSREKIELAMTQGEDDVKVDLANPVPVYTLYITTEASRDGRATFYTDVYGLDEELDHVLKRGFPYPSKFTPLKRDDQGRISTDVPTGTTR